HFVFLARANGLDRNEDQQEKQSPGEVKGNEHASEHQTAEDVNGIANPGIDAMCNQRASLGSYGEGTADLVTRDEKDDGGKEGDQETDCTRGVPGAGAKCGDKDDKHHSELKD